MLAETLKEIKSQIRKVSAIYDVLVTEWNGELINGKNATYPITVIVSVLLQNMGFDATNCHNYSHENAVKELYSKMGVLKSLNEYTSGEYMTHFAFTEVDFIVSGFEMSEINEYDLEREFFG
jgi:hypothetical protein